MTPIAALLTLCLAAEPEVREYRITVDGKPVGTYRLEVRPRGADQTEVVAEANVSARWFLKTYTYRYRGTEIWAGDRLVELKSSSDDNGRRYTVVAAEDTQRTQVTANGVSRSAPRGMWTTSHWRLPPGKKAGEVTRLDVDTGRIVPGKLELIGPASLTIGGRPVATTRYRITGMAPAELWFDENERLVRQETMEDGHRTILELTR